MAVQRVPQPSEKTPETMAPLKRNLKQICKKPTQSNIMRRGKGESATAVKYIPGCSNNS